MKRKISVLFVCAILLLSLTVMSACNVAVGEETTATEAASGSEITTAEESGDKTESTEQSDTENGTASSTSESATATESSTDESSAEESDSQQSTNAESGESDQTVNTENTTSSEAEETAESSESQSTEAQGGSHQVTETSGETAAESKTEMGTQTETQTKTETETETATDGKLEYCVKVVDGVKEGIQDVIVQIYKDGELVGMKPTDADGCASVRLEPATYQITLTSVDDKYYYEVTELTLTENSPSATVTAYSRVVSSDKHRICLSATGSNAFAPHVYEGEYYIKLSSGGKTYLAFVPQRVGVYRISVESKYGIDVGNYGGPAYVLADKINAEVTYFDLEVKERNIGTSVESTTVTVIGLDPGDGGATECILKIEWIGMPEIKPEDTDWTYISAPDGLEPFALEDGAALTDVNITDKNVSVVYSEADGYYHLGDENGPVILVKITENSPYLDAFETICNTTNFGAYIYDENGKFLRRENYNGLILTYAELCDTATGVYPLDETLAYVIKAHGEYYGWWELGSEGYIFGTEPIVVDNAWLFACCYVEE